MTWYTRNAGTLWTTLQVARLRQLARQNTPTRVIAFKLGKTEAAIRAKAQELGISLSPWDRSPYG